MSTLRGLEVFGDGGFRFKEGTNLLPATVTIRLLDNHTVLLTTMQGQRSEHRMTGIKLEREQLGEYIQLLTNLHNKMEGETECDKA